MTQEEIDKKKELAEKKKESRKKTLQRCKGCLEYKLLETKRYCSSCTKLYNSADNTYETELRKQMGLPPKTS